MQKIFFHTTETSFKLLNKRRIKLIIESMFTKEKVTLETLSLVFCSDNYLLKLNQDFLDHDFYTDVITFDLSEQTGLVIGEVYISLDRVKENALKLGIQNKDELLRVIFHGALHLCGYKDKKNFEIKEMRQKEEKYLLQFNALAIK